MSLGFAISSFTTQKIILRKKKFSTKSTIPSKNKKLSWGYAYLTKFKVDFS
jgi:hypothetical protein